MLSSTIKGMDCDNYSQIANYMENYLSTMHSNVGFAKSNANGIKILVPQFPTVTGNCTNQPGPLVSPSRIPARTDSHTFDLHGNPLKPTQRVVTDEPTWTTNSISNAMCVDYRTNKENDKKDISGHSRKDVSEKQRREVVEKSANASRLNKFVRRLYDMLCNERESGLVQWRRGLLVLLDTKLFTKQILPKYFNTRNFKTFRRQLNYYGFVHVRSYSNTGSKSTTALWVNQDLATGQVDGDVDDSGEDLKSMASVLQLKRVDVGEVVKTSESRRERKELALSTIEDELGVSAQFIALHQLHTLCSENTKAAVVLPQCSSQQNSSSIDNQERVETTLVKNQCRDESNGIDNAIWKPPTSSVSVANLLLLLSSG